MALLIKRTEDDLYRPHREGHIKPVCSCTDVNRSEARNEKRRLRYDAEARHDYYLRAKVRNHDPRKKLLTDDDVKKIRVLKKSGVKLVEIHKLYPNCSYPTICKAGSGALYKEVE